MAPSSVLAFQTTKTKITTKQAKKSQTNKTSLSQRCRGYRELYQPPFETLHLEPPLLQTSFLLLIPFLE